MSILSLDELQALRTLWRREARQLVLTNGVFDLLHRGHVEYLQRACALGDVLVVGINSDASTRAIKGPQRPLMPEADRAYLLAALRCVAYVTIFAEPTAEALVAALQPEIYVKGGDYATAGTTHPDETRLPEARVVQRYGGQVHLLPYRAGTSTTQLITRIAEQFRRET